MIWVLKIVMPSAFVCSSFRPNRPVKTVGCELLVTGTVGYVPVKPCSAGCIYNNHCKAITYACNRTVMTSCCSVHMTMAESALTVAKLAGSGVAWLRADSTLLRGCPVGTGIHWMPGTLGGWTARLSGLIGISGRGGRSSVEGSGGSSPMLGRCGISGKDKPGASSCASAPCCSSDR